MRRWCMMIGVTASVLAAALPARAEDDAQGGTGYLTLYPPNDVYHLEVIGDDAADGLQQGLTEAFQGDPHVQIKPKVSTLDAFMRRAFPDQLKTLDETLTREQTTISVVMIGPQDGGSFRGANGRKAGIDSDEWRAEFGRQIDSVMKLLKRQKQAVYWVSLPNVRRSDANDEVQVVNEIIRERSYLNGLKYIDAYAGFADEGGGYSAMGPDIAGKIRLLRESNGVGFTDAGNRKLAHFVERDLRRDLIQAKSDRTIPLAGNEAEQATISASRVAAALVTKTVTSGSPPPASNATQTTEAAAPPSTSGDQKADSGRINLAVPGPGGREDIITIDLLRPSISATVLALVNRRENVEKVTQLGDLLIDQIPGGLMVMSSITPVNDTNATDARHRLAPTQTPYFRVMVKGERITPREGRADDSAWPRPEPPPVAEPVVIKAAPPEVLPKVTSKKPSGARGKRQDPDAQSSNP